MQNGPTQATDTLPPGTSPPVPLTAPTRTKWLLFVAFACGIVCLVLAIAVRQLWHMQKYIPEPPFDIRTNDTRLQSAQDYSSLQWGDLDLLKIHDPILLALPDQPFATGASGAIYLGRFLDQQVAIKTLHSDAPTHVQSFIRELQVLGTIKSSHIVELAGVAWTHPGNIQGVMEYMDMGDLRTHLATTSPATFSWSAKINCADSIAKGLFYLHSMQMIHRDLKSRNVLVDSVKGAKLSDFGSSKEVVYGDTMTAAVGTFRWMAPEMLLFQGYSNAVDIFSFGVVLTELDSHALPYADLGETLSDEAIARRVIHGGLRPSFGQDCPVWVRTLALRCMAANPDDRPSATQIIYCIKTES
ncbi:hypothetical protein As57867_011834, partial [Aphanomyces stellatus]